MPFPCAEATVAVMTRHSANAPAATFTRADNFGMGSPFLEAGWFFKVVGDNGADCGALMAYLSGAVKHAPPAIIDNARCQRCQGSGYVARSGGTMEKAVGIRRPFPASNFGCGGGI